MNFTDLLGSLAQGMSPSSSERMRNSMGGGSGSLLESLAGSLGGRSGSSRGGVLDQILGQLGTVSSSTRSGGGLGQVLEQLGQGGGGNKKLATAGLGALAGALFGGGSKSLTGALGGGLMALLGSMAMQALQNSGRKVQAPVGLLEPQNERESQEREENARLIVEAMINAAKADGHISEDEVRRIGGHLQESGADGEVLRFVQEAMQKPLQTQALVAAVGGRQELAAEVYAASLLAIEVDTAQERQYLDQLGVALGLESQVTRELETILGVKAA